MLKKSLLYAATAALLTAGGLPVNAYAQDSALSTHSRLAESQLKTVMTYSQAYSLSGILTTSSLVGPLTKSSSGFGIERNVQTQKSVLFGGMPRALNPDNVSGLELTQAQALTMAKTWVAQYVKTSALSMAEEIQRTGAGAGIFTYTEEIKIARQDLEPITKVLSFIMTVDRSGRATYGAPVLTNPDPDIVYASYIPASAGDDFQENWKLPGAGLLTYQILDSKGNARTAKVELNTYGAYDATVGDSAQAVSCLMDKTNEGCSVPASVPDIKSLLLKHGADMAILDYTNQLIPVYDEIVDPTGEPEFVPRGAVSYTDRLWDCTQYKNTGYYGYVLEVSADRYFGTLTSENKVEHTFANKYSGTMASQVKAFDKSVLAAAIPAGTKPDQYVISPLENDTTLLRLGTPETSNLDYVAPVRSVGDTSAFTNARVEGDARSFYKTGTSDGYDNYYWGTGGNYNRYTGEYYSKLTFNLNSKNDFMAFGITYQFIDDWGVIKVNGIPMSSLTFGGLADVALTNYTTIESNCIDGYCGGVPFTQTYSATTGWYPSSTETIKAVTSVGTVNNWRCGPIEQETRYSPQTRRCLVNHKAEAYSSCIYNGSVESPYYECTRTGFCRSGQVYSIDLTYTDGRKDCFVGDAGAWRYDYIDLTPALRAGQNVIELKHVVTRGGHSTVNFQAAGCSAVSGYANNPPAPVPAGGTQSGITSSLSSKL